MTFALHRRLDGATVKASIAAMPATARQKPLSAFKFQCFEDPAPLADVWQSFEREAVGSVYQTYRWVSAWCQHAARPMGETPLILAGYLPSGELGFLWPMAVSDKYGVRVLTWLGQTHASYHMGLYRRDAAAQLQACDLRAALAAIVAAHPDVAALQFRNQPVIWDGVENPMSRLGHIASPTKSYELRLTNDFETIYKNIFSGNRRYEHRTKERRLAESGRLEFLDNPASGERLQILETFFEQKAAQFASKKLANPYHAEPVKTVYRAFASSQPAMQPSELVALKHNGSIIAIDYGMSHQRRFYGLMCSMPPAGDLIKYSPGQLLMRKRIEWLCAQGMAFCDFGPGDGFHKQTWHATPVDLFETHLPLSFKGWPATLMQRSFIAAKREIKARPRLRRLAEQGAGLLRGAGNKAKQD